MLAWRLCRAPFVALDGEGARRHGGRWNTRGHAIVYAAATAALAVLEVRVNLDLPFDLLPDDYTLVTIDLSAATMEDVPVLPPNPRSFGDLWLREQRSPVLRVPSVTVPESANLLINPAHPTAAGITIQAQRPFAFDPRLW